MVEGPGEEKTTEYTEGLQRVLGLGKNDKKKKKANRATAKRASIEIQSDLFNFPRSRT
jgi:hypothetical protein